MKKGQRTTLLERAGTYLKQLGGALARDSAFSFGGEIFRDIGSVPVGDVRISTNSLYLVWRNHADVFACIRELSENCSGSGYEWENVNDNTKDPDANEVKLAESVLNFNQPFRRVKNLTVQDAHISGNAYWLLQRSAGSNQPIGIQPVDPRTMYVVTDQYGSIVRWVQHVNGQTAEYAPDEILHFKLFNDPNSPVFGLSPLETIIWEVRTDLAAMVSNYAFFQNDAQPAAQYILDENLGDDEAARAIDSIQRQLKGAENRHKSIAIKGVKEIKQLSISQKDMEFHVLRQFTTEKVCSALGVPKAILNYTDDVNRANGQEQTRKFWEGTIEPLNQNLAEFINKVFLPAIGVLNIKLVFKERKFDTREYVETSTREDLKMGVYTINEVRKLRGLDPYDPIVCGEFVDKPLLFQGSATVPVEDVGTVPQDIVPVMSDAQAAKEMKRIGELAERLAYAKPTSKRV